jgi:hypothetical protein
MKETVVVRDLYELYYYTFNGARLLSVEDFKPEGALTCSFVFTKESYRTLKSNHEQGRAFVNVSELRTRWKDIYIQVEKEKDRLRAGKSQEAYR